MLMLMLIPLLIGSALAETPTALNKPVQAPPSGAENAPMGALHIDAKVPAELIVDGQRVGQLFVPSELRVPLPAGSRALSVVREGRPENLTVDIAEDDATLLLVGRTGTTVGAAPLPDEAPDPYAPVAVELRVVGDSTVQLRLSGSRLALNPGQLHTVHLPPGRYPMSVRNEHGTVIWANGTLHVQRGPQVVVQLSEGRLPELTGEARFLATRK